MKFRRRLKTEQVAVDLTPLINVFFLPTRNSGNIESVLSKGGKTSVTPQLPPTELPQTVPAQSSPSPAPVTPSK